MRGLILILGLVSLVGCTDISVMKVDLNSVNDIPVSDTYEFYAFRKLEPRKISLMKFTKDSVEVIETYELELQPGSNPQGSDIELEIETLSDINGDSFREVAILNHKFLGTPAIGSVNYHSIIDGKTGVVLNEIRTGASLERLNIISMTSLNSIIYVGSIYAGGTFFRYEKTGAYSSVETKDQVVGTGTLVANVVYLDKIPTGEYVVVEASSGLRVSAKFNNNFESPVLIRTIANTLITNIIDIDFYEDSIEPSNTTYDFLIQESQLIGAAPQLNILFNRFMGGVFSWHTRQLQSERLVSHVHKNADGSTAILMSETSGEYGWRDLNDGNESMYNEFTLNSDKPYPFVFEKKVRPNYFKASANEDLKTVFFITNNMVDVNSDGTEDLILMGCESNALNLKKTNLNTKVTTQYRQYSVDAVTTEICN